MIDLNPQPEMNAYEFILENIDSVPQLEALVLLWNSRPVAWSCEELASRLYLPAEKVSNLIQDLVRLQLIMKLDSSPQKYSYFAVSDEQNEMMRMVDSAYRRDLVRISTMIHSKTSPGVREFARAFRFKKERD
jgi:hypothetical protein